MSWAVKVGLINDLLLDLEGGVLGELSSWLSSSKDLTWMLLWVDKTSSESGLVWCIFRVIIWVSRWLCSSAISSRGGVKGIIVSWDVNNVESVKYKQKRVVRQMGLILCILTRWTT